MLKQKGRISVQVLKKADKRLEEYPTTLNFYHLPPTDQVTLFEFETYSLDRLRVLKQVENARIRCKTDEEMIKFIEPCLQQYMDLKRNTRLQSVGAEVLYNERRKDHISHFILRLAYCRTEDLRSWLLRQETLLFKLRFMQEQQQDRHEFTEMNNLNIEQVSMDDIVRMLYPQYASWDGTPNLLFYKTPFHQVPELVAKRQVLLHRGNAFVAEQERIVLVVNAFKQHLDEQLEITAKAVPGLDEQDRLVPILDSLSKQFVSRDYTPNQNGTVTHESIPELSKHFSPCMKHLYDALQRDAHLKHMGRLQFGLFLKGIGLTLEEAMIFWRKSFNRMTDEEFQKKGYSYGVRYNYGMEGKRTNYTPYSCVKIISTMPGPQEAHGCPFRHFSAENLSSFLMSMRIKESDCQEIVQKAQDHHYQIACTRLFEVMHETSVDAIDHPNQWFDLSIQK
ncbi:eukaryotic and archaeal DNA primase, large subunit-domain-containing protein [Gorgonomyces haynaldii]|nr:eukaryotic and archaeal DNA primase, large subunit-domain-containing protein [Gorgonomyces haynaldii]